MSNDAPVLAPLDLTAQQALIDRILPIAATLEMDHWHVFLAVCEEDGISLQKLGRLTGLGQSEVIRAVSVLENWQAEAEATSGLLRTVEEEARSYRRQSFLTEEGKQLRDVIRASFGVEDYTRQALDFHRFLQQELAQYRQQVA